jgi:hypothetical protein
MHANRITRTVHPQDDFIATWADLAELYTASLEQNQIADRLPLQEQEFVTRKRSGSCA